MQPTPTAMPCLVLAVHMYKQPKDCTIICNIALVLLPVY